MECRFQKLFSIRKYFNSFFVISVEANDKGNNGTETMAHTIRADDTLNQLIDDTMSSDVANKSATQNAMAKTKPKCDSIKKIVPMRRPKTMANTSMVLMYTSIIHFMNLRSPNPQLIVYKLIE